MNNSRRINRVTGSGEGTPNGKQVLNAGAVMLAMRRLEAAWLVCTTAKKP